MTFKSETVPGDWKDAVIVHLHKDKGDCKNYGRISQMNVSV